VELAVPRKPFDQPVELRPVPVPVDIVVNVEVQLVTQVVFNSLAVPLD
jgi:hypothetical protein